MTRLGQGALVEELVRMLGADQRDAGARRHAEELLRGPAVLTAERAPRSRAA